MQILYPELMAEIQRRGPEEMPKLRRELDKQMVLLVSDSEEMIRGKITDDATLVVRVSIARGVEKINLTAEQQDAVDQFAKESVELIMTDMQPFINNETERTAAHLKKLYETFYNLENSRLAQYLWPANPEDATFEHC